MSVIDVGLAVFWCVYVVFALVVVARLRRRPGPPRTWRDAELEADGLAYARGEIDFEEFNRRVDWTLASNHSEHCLIFEPSGACTCGGPDGLVRVTRQGHLVPMTAQIAGPSNAAPPVVIPDDAPAIGGTWPSGSPGQRWLLPDGSIRHVP